MTTIRIVVLDYESIPDTLIELKLLVDNALASVPPEYRDKIEIGRSFDSGYLLAYYERPETDKEREARELGHKRDLVEQEARERRQLERLKEKYEGAGRPPFVMK